MVLNPQHALDSPANTWTAPQEHVLSHGPPNGLAFTLKNMFWIKQRRNKQRIWSATKLCLISHMSYEVQLVLISQYILDTPTDKHTALPLYIVFCFKEHLRLNQRTLLSDMRSIYPERMRKYWFSSFLSILHTLNAFVCGSGGPYPFSLPNSLPMLTSYILSQLNTLWKTSANIEGNLVISNNI